MGSGVEMFQVLRIFLLTFGIAASVRMQIHNAVTLLKDRPQRGSFFIQLRLRPISYRSVFLSIFPFRSS